MSPLDSKSTVKVVVSLVLIGVAAAIVIPRLAPEKDVFREGIMGALSPGLAAEIETLNGGAAKIVCVSQANSRSAFASEKAVGTFAAAAQKEGHTIVAREFIPLGEMHAADMGIYLNGASLADIMGRHADADVFVSFVGSPHLGSGDAGALAATTAKLVVISLGQPGLDQLLANGVVDMAVEFSDELPLDDPDLISPEKLQPYINYRRTGG